MNFTNFGALIMQFSPALVTSSLLGTDTLVNLVFLSAVSLYSSLIVKN